VKLKLYHKIDAKHARNIGEESVSNAVQAVIELVKNSRDADATKCVIRFAGHKTEDGSIIYDKILFQDNGIGMTYEDMETKYFWIGTDFKERYTISPVFKRRVVGSKGMGHFSAQRLGQVCRIESNPWKYPGREHSESVDKKIIVNIDWRKFQPGMEFGDIPSLGDMIERPPQAVHGLKIELSELKDEWTKDDINDIVKSLSILQTPKALLDKKDQSFTIDVQADDLDIEPSALDTTILDNAMYKLEARIKGGKRYWTFYEHKKAGTKWVRVPEMSSMDVKVGGETVDATCGDARFEVYHFDTTKSFYDLPIQYKAVQDFLGDWKGIRIFKDNVRLMPYGDYTSLTLFDWMDWEKKQRYGPRVGALVGFVWLTSDANPGIQEVTSRQAVAENKAFKSLKEDLVVDLLSRYHDWRHKNRLESKAAQVQQNLQNKSQVALEHLERQISAMTDIDPEDKQVVVSELKKVAKQIGEMQRESGKAHKEQLDNYVADLDLYRPLATLGLSSLHFDHEVAPKLNTMNMGLKNLDHKMRKDGYDDKEILAKAIKQVSAIQGWGNYIEIFGKYLSGASARKAKEKLNIRSMVNELQESLKSLLIVKTREKNPRTVDINVEIAILGNISTVYANGAALASVFANLMTNSVKSLRESGRTNPKIKISVWKEYSNIFIEFEDNGIGVMDEYQERMWASFKSFFPAKRKGMGLGMTITKEIIEEQFHGQIKLDKTKYEGDHPGKGFARFLISIPAKELQGP